MADWRKILVSGSVGEFTSVRVDNGIQTTTLTASIISASEYVGIPSGSGAQGPQGPAGVSGSDGSAGAQGAQGPQGPSSGGTGSGTIGEAEDGTYTDGLFTDFFTGTPIGVAIDRFNEILLNLAPAPAPDLDNIDFNSLGTATVKLAFGASNVVTGYVNVSASLAGLPARDLNETYDRSGNRFGVFNSLATREGTLNEDAPVSGINYPANAFGDADKGVLVLEVNGNEIHETSLSGSDAAIASSLNSSGSGFINLSAATPATFEATGQTLDNFKHRTGAYRVHSSEQRRGHNYVKVVHRKPFGDVITNYVDWAIDDESVTSQKGLDQTGSWSFAPGTTLTLSGVKYYTGNFESSTVVPYTASVTSLFEKVYPTSNGIQLNTTSNIGSKTVNFSGPGVTPSSQTDPSGNASFNHPSLNPSASAADETPLTASVSIVPAIGPGLFHHSGSFNSSLGNNSAGLRWRMQFSTVFRGTVTTSIWEEDSYLYNDLSTNANVWQFEDFKKEIYRLQTGSIAAGINTSSLAWDSTVELTSANAGHNSGLCIYNTYAVYPSVAGDNGNFTTSKGPASQPDYTSAVGERSYIRYFIANSSTNSLVGGNSFGIELVGSGKAVAEGSSFYTAGSDAMKVYFSRSNNNDSVFNNTWVNMFNNDVRIGSTISNINTQYIPVGANVSYNTTIIGGSTFEAGVIQVQDAGPAVSSVGDIYAVKIVVPADFTGNINALALKYSTSTNPGTIPVLGNTYGVL